MYDVHTQLGVLCCNLQERYIIFSDISALIDYTIGKLDAMKLSDGEGLSQMKNNITIKDDNAYYKGDELKSYSTQADAQFETLRDNYVTNIGENLRKRIRKYDCDIFQSISQLLEPSTVKHVTPNRNRSSNPVSE